MLLLDNSAWSHLNSDRVAPERRDEVIRWMQEDMIATCLPFLLEAGYSARSADDHTRIISDFNRLSHIPITPQIEHRAQEAQRRLARVGHHRLAPLDLLIAACAESEGAGVLHYDRDYDLIAEHARLRFDSVWLAPAGSL